MEVGRWLLAALLLSGERCEKDTRFVYGRVGGDAFLPCPLPDSSACSSVSWTFYRGGGVQYTEPVSRGHLRTDSERSGRMWLTSTCSLGLRGLRPEDAGAYTCVKHQEAVGAVYLSVLAVESPSSITELQAGGRLVLSCVLFTYYDAGSCKSYSSSLFQLSWRAEDGGVLAGSRYQLVAPSRCNVTVVTTLQTEDGGRRWRCQVDPAHSGAAQFVNVRSNFLFGNTETQQKASVPVSRLALCVALPLMVVAVGLFTWKQNLQKDEGACECELMGVEPTTSIPKKRN